MTLTGLAKRIKVDGGAFLQSVEGAQLDQVELLYSNVQSGVRKGGRGTGNGGWEAKRPTFGYMHTTLVPKVCS